MAVLDRFPWTLAPPNKSLDPRALHPCGRPGTICFERGQFHSKAKGLSAIEQNWPLPVHDQCKQRYAVSLWARFPTQSSAAQLAQPRHAKAFSSSRRNNPWLEHCACVFGMTSLALEVAPKDTQSEPMINIMSGSNKL